MIALGTSLKGHGRSSGIIQALLAERAITQWGLMMVRAAPLQPDFFDAVMFPTHQGH